MIILSTIQIQTGDPSGTGAGGESYWDTPFRDEYDLKGAAKHDSRGVLAMANKGPATNGCVQCSEGNYYHVHDFQFTILHHIQSNTKSRQEAYSFWEVGWW